MAAPHEEGPDAFPTAVQNFSVLVQEPGETSYAGPETAVVHTQQEDACPGLPDTNWRETVTVDLLARFAAPSASPAAAASCASAATGALPYFTFLKY